MGDSAEEMLNVTMKRIESIMDSFPAKQALEAETHNLIDAAITVLKTYKKDLTTDKVAGLGENPVHRKPDNKG